MAAGPRSSGQFIGGFWVNGPISVLFLAMAGGAIVYVVKELLYHGRVNGESVNTMASLVLGFVAGFATDVLVKYVAG